MAALADGAVTEFEIAPEDAGLAPRPFEEIVGGSPEENAVAFIALLDGAQSAYREAVLLNSAAALVVADHASDLGQGVEMAKDSIDSGAAKTKVQALARLTSEAA